MLINPPSDGILEVIKKHFVKKYNVNPKYLDIDSIESYKNKKGELEYYLDFSITRESDYITQYWGDISHSEVMQDIRDDKLKSILDDKDHGLNKLI